MIELERRLFEGAGIDDEAIAEALGVAASDEEAFARALVARLAAAESRGGEELAERGECGVGDEAAPVASDPRDFLRRLAPIGDAERPGIDRIDDEDTLFAVLWGGNLRQRRAVIARLGEVAAAKDAEGRARIDEALAAVRDEDLALDVDHARARFAEANEGPSDQARVADVFAQLGDEIRRFYDGELERDPLESCDAESRAIVGTRLREASPAIVAHVEAYLGGSEEPSMRSAWMLAVRGSGDPRLAPSLGALLDSPSSSISRDAARALGRIDTETARVLLAEAFRRTSTPADRALLGGMLALHGVERVGGVSILGELRETIRAEDPNARLLGVEAIGPIATSEDFELLAGLLESGSLALDRALVRSLGRFGDPRAVRLLRSLLDSERGGALANDVREAIRAVRARMALRGEKVVPEPRSVPALRRAPSPWWSRALARYHLLVARMLVALGASRRALGRLERAASAAHEDPRPWLSKGRLFEARGSYAEALVVFRRALELDRAEVEGSSVAMRSLARAFLRRSEAMDAEGRRDVARGLLDEVLALDLRRVPASLRQAIRRERERLAHEDLP